jgi:hypothetical protein
VSRQDSLAAPGLVNRRPEQKQHTSVYTMMLILAFVAISIGCVVLWFELQEYGEFPWWKTDGVPAVTSQLAPLPVESSVVTAVGLSQML